MYKDKTNDELLIILSEVCSELESRAIGIADHGGKPVPIIQQDGNTVTCVHIGSNLGVQVFRDMIHNLSVAMFEKGQSLTSATTLSRFIKPTNGSKETGEANQGG